MFDGLKDWWEETKKSPEQKEHERVQELRATLTAAEREELDGLSLAASWGAQSEAGIRRMHELEAAAEHRLATGKPGTRKNR